VDYLRLVLGSYLLGAVPFAYVTARFFRGIDIRRVGSRNAGATNVLRQVGFIPALITGVCDVAKGTFAVWWAGAYLGEASLAPLVALVAAMIGHNWSIWLRFEGGGGAATFFGGMLAIAWGTLLYLVPLWALSYRLTRHKYLSSVLTCGAIPIVLGTYLSSWQHFYFGMAAGCVMASKQVTAWLRAVSQSPQLPPPPVRTIPGAG
jgi:glycerol-3-phosphate acyltransferase PlsY